MPDRIARRFSYVCALWRRLRPCIPLVALISLFLPVRLFAQAALLLEEPYGVFGHLNPTGHAALYLSRVCADTPVHLRLCGPGETGIVLSRYEGIGHYDWVAMPLLPYLYAVETAAKVPAHVDAETVRRLRDHYREKRLAEFTDGLPKGGFFSGGWTELIGAAYERRIYALRFNTTPAQDQTLIDHLNGAPNVSHFHLLTNNCSDFDRYVLNLYFPGKFRRSVFPDAGLTTPRHIAHRLVVYAHRHHRLDLSVYEIPQVPGYRHPSHSNHGVAESLLKSGYVVPIVILSPYVAGGLLADYLITGRDRILPHHVPHLDPAHLDALAKATDSTPGNNAVLTPTVMNSENARSSVIVGTAPASPTVVAGASSDTSSVFPK
uniref:DUF4105 domain-containing protein n=1 Tax=mine drainage metagenome TaxID=410659 RepID=E6Q019_9ZZZZ